MDSGDLAYLFIEARKLFHAIEKEFNVIGFGKTAITASNDLNEETIDALNKQVMRYILFISKATIYLTIFLVMYLCVLVHGSLAVLLFLRCLLRRIIAMPIIMLS